MTSAIVFAGRQASSAPIEGTGRVTASCGTLDDQDGATGVDARVRGGQGRARYRCDQSLAPCCSGTSATIDVTLGTEHATTTVFLSASASGAGGIAFWPREGPSGGTSGGGRGGGASSFSAGEVVLRGTLSLGSDYHALADLDSPGDVSVGLPDSFWIRGVGDGTVFYLDDFDTARKMVADEFTWDAASEGWRYPWLPGLNDEEVSTPACPNAVGDFIMQQGSTRIVYRCLDGWYDQSSDLVTTADDKVLAWNANDSFLVVDDTYEDYYRILDGTQDIRTTLPYYYWYAKRAHDSGFWVVSDDTRYFIGRDGTVTPDGVYADSAECGPPDWGVLDADGNFYAFNTSYSMVCRYPDDGGTPEVVYDVADAPDEESTPWVRTGIYHAGLITGP